jgi:hypothetical protein
VSLHCECVSCLCLVVPVVLGLLLLSFYSPFFNQDQYILITFLLSAEGWACKHIVHLPCCRYKDVHSNISASQEWSIHTSIRGMMPMVHHHRYRKHATIITPIDTAATSRPSHNTPTCIARIRKATMSHIPPTSTSTTRYPSPKRQPMHSEQTQGLPLWPHPCHHNSNQYP